MKKYISGLLVLIAGFAFSQTILNASSPEEYRKLQNDNMRIVGDSMVSNKITPLKYGYVDEKDIRKSIYVWEVIDLNDKINQPFYYDNKSGFSNQTKSLYTVLLDGAKSGKIAEVYDDENFTRRLSIEEINKRLVSKRVDDGLVDIIQEGRTPTQAEIDQYTDLVVTTSDKVKMLKMMGMWFIDVRDGQMKYRPLGIAAMGPDPAVMGRVDSQGNPLLGANELIDLFWIFYPDARELLANNAVYNKNNSAADLNFDDLINARRFSSIIYKSSNGTGDGKIADYIPKNADEQLEESNRIKGQILAMENELWNY
ncbi:type IX secretion system ring subunit PorN/GldN [Frigoriflavimonas asaccharolytica]|uniref:Gliding motility associated protein GldN n=1 Tax=Frigoriflavimonas asaccharolytica TaxID=2735899 RepID=A0A8J8GAD5_9FLAO|nr:gliding motility protein GldN [Frigoriflavimonas asaccharolytica]NRS92320.1 gliding motility associated protein GldN [Frigoriflavimonas asaccharolytica]